MANKILIIEDEKDMLEMLEMRLKPAGYETISAYDGQEGLETARSEMPDLIILDLMLPRMDGFKVCRMLKFDERFKHIPIIIVSAKATDADKAMGMEVGADAYMMKPFEPKVLLEKIKSLLKK